MDRCRLDGDEANARYVVLCSAWFNICWLLWVIARLGLASFLLALFALALHAGASAKNLVQPGFEPISR